VFLQKGYLATNMDEIAALAAVSKQTVYKNFPGKETLFVEIVSSVTNRASDRVHSEIPDLAEGEDIGEYLRRYAYRQLTVVLTPRVMQLRRLVIGGSAAFLSWRGRSLMADQARNGGAGSIVRALGRSRPTCDPRPKPCAPL
jgi:TetR/AcrR family transcriptional repressor of mexJK operon